MGRTVLVLDDDALFRAMVTPALEGRGFKVIQAASGAQADAALAKERPDLLVVDGLLPDTSGLDWISRVRGSGNDVPIIFASAFWRDAGTARKLTQVHKVAAILGKPLAPEALAEKVELELGKRAPEASAEEPIELSEEEIDVNLDVEPFLEDPKELAVARMDAARTLSSRIRELTELVDKAQRKRDTESAVHAWVRAQKLVSLALACEFSDVVASARSIEEALRRIKAAPQGGPPQPWSAVSQGLEGALRVARQASRPGAYTVAERPRLLVVDADPTVLGHLSEMLPRSFCELLCASDAEGAAQLAKEHRPHAALLDAGLPEIDGIELAGILRALPGLDGLAVGFIAGAKGAKQQLAAARDFGALAFLSRPLARDTVIEALCQLLRVPPPPRPRIFVVGDDADFSEELTFGLARRGMETVPLTSQSATVLQLHANPPSALCVDLDGAGKGLELVRGLRRHARWRDLPLLALGPKDFAPRRQALEAGADAALRKSAGVEEIGCVLAGLLDRADALSDRLGYDALTQLPTRRTFLDAFAQRLADARRNTRTLTVCLMRLEGLEAVNRELGLETGDELLKELAQQMRDRFRAEDLRGRWSGASFVVVFQGSSSQNVAKVLGRAREEYLKSASSRLLGTAVTLALSSGLSTFPLDGTTAVELLQAAQGRLAQARVEEAKVPPLPPKARPPEPS